MYKKLAFLAESTWGTASGPTGSQYLRRVGSTLGTEAAFFKSNEINFDRQLRDNRKGQKMIKGDISGELSPGTWQAFLQAILAASSATTAATITASTIVAVAGPPGQFTIGSGFLTAGFKVGDIVRSTGWTTTATANNSRNYRITALTDTTMTVGTSATGATGYAEAVIAKAAGDSVTIAVVGKKAVSPLTSLADTSFSIEHFFSDNSFSELFTGCKPVQVQISMPSTAIATIKVSFIGKDVTTATSQYFTTPSSLTTSSLLAGVNGSLMVGGTDYGTITGLTININGNHNTESVVGLQTAAGVFPGRLEVSGSVTALFSDTAFRDMFIAETDYIDLHAKLVTNNNINADFIAFNLPRLKMTSASKDDKPNAILGTYNFQAALNLVGGSGTNTDACSLSVQDSLFT
jgi:hypothetical protein